MAVGQRRVCQADRWTGRQAEKQSSVWACPLMKEEAPYVVVVTYMFPTLSIIGCVMMIVNYFYSPKDKDRAAAHLFCLWLGISGIGLASTSFVFMNVENGDFLCTLLPLVEDYFILCSSFTTVVIANRVKKIVFQHEGCLSLSESQLKTYCVCVWGIPLLLVLLPLTTGAYGRNDGDLYCFIKYDGDGKEKDNVIAKCWVFGFYGPVLLSVCTIMIIYWQCIQQINILQVRLDLCVISPSCHIQPSSTSLLLPT